MGVSESTLVKMPHCWKSHVAAHINYHEPMSSIRFKLACAYIEDSAEHSGLVGRAS